MLRCACTGSEGGHLATGLARALDLLEQSAAKSTEGGYTQRRGQHYPVPVAQKKGEKGKPRSGDGLKAKTKRVVESLIAASDSHTDDELKDGRVLVPSFCQQLL